MSQAGRFFDGSLPPGGGVQTLTGDLGGAVGPDGANNIDLLGGNQITVTGNPGINTLTIDLDATIADTYTTDAGNAIPAAGVLNVLGGLLINTSGAGNTVTINLDNALDGQIPIAATAGNVAYANITSADASVTITNGANSIDLSVAGAGGIQTLTGDAGGAVGPDGAGDIAIIGGTSIATVGNPGANSITINVDGDVATIFDADVGSAIPNLNTIVIAGGDNINTSAAGDTVTVHLNEVIRWPDTNGAGTSGVIYLGGAGGAGGTRFMHNFGTNNTFLGSAAGNFTTTSSNNVGIGRGALDVVTSGNSNVAVGVDALGSSTTGTQNIAIGVSALGSLTVSDGNTAIGWRALASENSGSTDFGNNVAVGLSAGDRVTSGYVNTLIGTHAAHNQSGLGITTGYANVIIGSGDINASVSFASAGSALRSDEHENILISNSGVVGEDNTIRIGGQFLDDPIQTRCFITGIRDVTPAGTGELVIIDTNDQLGSINNGATGTLLTGTGANPAFATSSDGNFTFTSSAAGTNRLLTVTNTDNTNAASAATLQLTTGGASAGDPKTTYTVTGVTSFTTGIDNSAADSYKIAASTALGTTDTFIMTTAGERTMPLQPAFLANLSADATNVTGAGANYTLIADTEIFDQNADYNNATGVFTAPITGRYAFTTGVLINELTAAMTASLLQLVTSNRNYSFGILNAGAVRSLEVVNRIGLANGFLTDMDAGDTAFVRITVSAGAGNTADVGTGSKFAGFLAC